MMLRTLADRVSSQRSPGQPSRGRPMSAAWNRPKSGRQFSDEPAAK